MSEKLLTPVARKLRRNSTDVEALPWSQLRASRLSGRKFVRQFPIGRAVVDLACRSAKLAIKLDGGQHATALSEDADRTAMIEAYGYSVIRFWNDEVTENLDGMLEEIIQALRIAGNR